VFSGDQTQHSIFCSSSHVVSVLYESLVNSAVLRWSCFVIEPNGVRLLVALYTAHLLVVKSHLFHTS